MVIGRIFIFLHRVLMFLALALLQSESRNSELCVVYTSQATLLLREFMAKVEKKNKLDERKAFVDSVGFGR